jgi:hypothetical protein
LCKRVRPRNHSLLGSVSVVSLSQCWGHTWLSFIKTTALLFKHFRIGETPVLDISNLQELPGFTEEPVVIDVLKCVCGQWVLYQKNWCLVFSENHE